MRNPFDTLKAEFMRQHKKASKEIFSTKGNKIDLFMTFLYLTRVLQHSMVINYGKHLNFITIYNRNFFLCVNFILSAAEPLNFKITFKLKCLSIFSVLEGLCGRHVQEMVIISHILAE